MNHACSRVLAVCVTFLFVPSLFVAQDLGTKGRSTLGLEFGLWGGIGASTSIGLSGTQSAVDGSGFVGGLAYAYGLEDNLAVTLSAGLLAVQAKSSVGLASVSQHVSSVVPILLGIQYYVPYPAPDTRVRPFISASIGSFIGSEVKSAVLAQESRTETAFGGKLGAGIDFLLGSHFKLAALVGHHVMTDFASPIGGRKHYNGTGFSLGAGYIF